MNSFANFDAGAATVVIGDAANLTAVSGTDIKAASGGGPTCNGGLALRGAGGC
jgi:hypothetical protein